MAHDRDLELDAFREPPRSARAKPDPTGDNNLTVDSNCDAPDKCENVSLATGPPRWSHIDGYRSMIKDVIMVTDYTPSTVNRAPGSTLWR